MLPLTAEIRQRAGVPSSVDGVLAVRVIAGSPTAVAGLTRGDVITGINGSSVSSAREFYQALAAVDDPVEFQINRGGREIGIRVGR